MSPGPRARIASAGGFTLLELLVALTILALVSAMVLPNLGMFVPSARLEGSGKQILRTIDMIRSEARIQARPMSLEFDLEHARWRQVWPAEMRLSMDQTDDDIAESLREWKQLEDGVVFAGVGDQKRGMVKKGIYRMTFDEHGFSSDQLIVLKLSDDPKLVWGMSLRGLTGSVTVEESEKGEEPDLTYVEEGAF